VAVKQELCRSGHECHVFAVSFKIAQLQFFPLLNDHSYFVSFNPTTEINLIEIIPTR